MATIDEIARRAKVSKTTVSFVINGKSGVSESTAAHVRRVMAEMNYVPSALAQRFASRKANAVALIVLPYPQVFRDPHHGEALDAVHDTLEAQGYSLVLSTSNVRFVGEKRYATMLRSGQVDGMLLLEPTLDQEYLQDLAVSDEPVVIINGDGAHLGIDYVRTDDVEVGRMAARYFHQLGHRHIGIIAASPHHASARDRLRGFREMLAELGAPLDGDRIFHGAFDTSYWSGQEGCTEILRQRPDTTALFCCNDTMALGALEAARCLNRAVPQTLSIIGVDDHPAGTYCQPAITTLRQPSHEAAKQATQILLDRLDEPNDTPHRHVGRLLPPTLIERESCGPPPDVSDTGGNGRG